MTITEISIKFIPQNAMRYETLGDWWLDGEVMHIRSSIEEGQRQAFLVSLHELVECWLCMEEGISQESVDAFDFSYEGDAEPGDSEMAPYRTQHRRAMILEHLMANFMGMTTYGEIC